MLKKIGDQLIFRLLLAIVLGLICGYYLNSHPLPGVLAVVATVKNIIGQIIFYCVPLIVLGFITPAIVSLRENAGKILSVTLLVCYVSSLGAAAFSMFAGYQIIPFLNINSVINEANHLPKLLFDIKIQPIIPVFTALVTSILFGIAILKTKAEIGERIFRELHQIVLYIVEKVVIRLMPFFIFSTFTVLTYEGEIIHNLPVFVKIIGIVIVGHFIWMALLYVLGGLAAKRNPWGVIRYYMPAYMTAVGTMSSAATLSVALSCARKSKDLDPEIRDFAIPICANTHLCGSVLTEVFFVMTVSQILYGRLPDLGDMILFIVLLGFFAIAAPGVPGGTVVASLGLITSVLGFDETGTALMLSIFALQDSFGTACNVTGDGAIALFVTGLFKKVPPKAEVVNQHVETTES